MAQYSTLHNPIEAYQIGNADVPQWFQDALRATRQPYIRPSIRGTTVAYYSVYGARGPLTAQIGDYISPSTTEGFKIFPKTVFEATHILDVATLTSVLTKTDAAPTGSGSAEDPTLWSISVLNTVDTVGATNIVVGKNATFKLFSDADFEEEVEAPATISLTAEDDTVVYIQVTSEHGTQVLHYAVTIARAAAA